MNNNIFTDPFHEEIENYLSYVSKHSSDMIDVMFELAWSTDEDIKNENLVSKEVYSQVLEACGNNEKNANEFLETLKVLILPLGIEKYKQVAEDFVKVYPQSTIIKKIIEYLDIVRSMVVNKNKQ